LTKAKVDKQIKGKPPVRGFPCFAFLLIVLAIAGVAACAPVHPTSQTPSQTPSHTPNHIPSQPPPDNLVKPRAAIVDQLYNVQPNQDFITKVTRELEDYGFEVDLYQGDEITVDFYRQLPSYGHKLIVFRAHSGLLAQEEVIRTTSLFTNEPYSSLEHVADQLDDRLVKARVDEQYPLVFAITPKFITQSMAEEFNSTAIIMMGCSCLYLTDLAMAFIDKGASVCLGWDGTVDLAYVDRATPYLMGQLCTEEATIREAVKSTRNVIGPDPKYNAVLRYYPPDNADSTLEQLIELAVDEQS
jgi:hypothetical protein